MGNALVRRCRARNGCGYDRLKEERARGQRALRNLVARKTVEEVDWEVLIEKAEELHRAEQRRLHEGEEKWKRRQRRKSQALRRRYANDTGVYCINLLSHEEQGSSYCGEEEAKLHSQSKIDVHPPVSRTFGLTSSSDNIRGTPLLSSSSSSSSSSEDDTITTASAMNHQHEAIITVAPPSPVNGTSPTITTTASIASYASSTMYLLEAESSQQGYVTPRASNRVDRLEPIDMVDLFSKYYSSSDDDDEDEDGDDDETNQDHISTLRVHQDVSGSTDETDSHKEYVEVNVNHPELRSEWRGSFRKKVYLKSLAPDGSHQITL